MAARLDFDIDQIGPFKLDDLHFGLVKLSDLQVRADRIHVSTLFDVEGDSILSYLNPKNYSLNSARLSGHLLTKGTVELMPMGLMGRGRYSVDFTDIKILHGTQLSFKISNRIDIDAGSLRFLATISGVGSSTIDRIRISEVSRLKELALRGLNRATMNFDIDARLQGPFFQLEATGQGQVSSSRAEVNGQFRGGMPLLITSGRYQFNLAKGLRLQGGSVGLLLKPINDVGPGVKSLSTFSPLDGGSLSGDTSSKSSFGLLEPGFLQFGASLFDVNVSSGSGIICSVGAAFGPGRLPYYPHDAQIQWPISINGMLSISF